MKKKKRCLALLIAMVMTASVCFGNGPMMTIAAETTEDTAVEEVVNLFEQLPEASEIESMSEEELSEIMQQTVDAINAFDGLSTDECDYFIENYSELYNAVMGDLSNALAALQQGNISTMSLLPLEEVEAYLILSGYTEQELTYILKLRT